MSRKQVLLTVADNIEGFWCGAVGDLASDDLRRIAKEDADAVRRVAATLPDEDDPS